jgi:hypothetical protein
MEEVVDFSRELGMELESAGCVEQGSMFWESTSPRFSPRRLRLAAFRITRNNWWSGNES